MIIRLFLIAIISQFVLLGCKSKKEKINTVEEKDSTLVVSTKPNEDKVRIEDEPDEVIAHTIENEPNWLTLKNLRFSFEIDVPKKWKAEDISGNGDGFIISIPNQSDVEIKVYGENNTPDLLSIYLELCNESNDFTFSNNHTGTLCIGPKERTYTYVASEFLINVYINNIENLSKTELDDFIKMSKSLRASKSSNQPT